MAIEELGARTRPSVPWLVETPVILM